MSDEELIARLRSNIFGTGTTMLAADRVEALIEERDEHWNSFVHWRKEADDRAEQLAAARQDADEAEAYAWELEQRLAKTVKALEDIVKDCEADYPPSHGAIKYFARATLAEIKGESHE